MFELGWGRQRVHVEDDGTGEPVVLLHSSGMSGRQWHRLAQRIVETGRRAVVPDLLGHGRSSPWPDGDPFSFEADVELVAALVARIDQPVHLVGHSYGGLIALQAALRAAVRSLALYDPVAFGVLDPDRDAEALADLSRVDWTVQGDAWLAEFVEYWNGPGAWLQLKAPTRAEFSRVGWVAREGARSLTQTPPTGYARLIMPALLLTGSESPLAVRRVVERLDAVLPDAHMVTVAGAGHMGPLTHADRVNAAILDHLGPSC